MDIRILTKDDASNYLAIRHRAVKEEPESFLPTYEEERQKDVDTYEEMLADALSKTYGVFDNHELVGVTTVVQNGHEKMKHIAQIVGVYLAPEHRGKGYSKAMFERIVNDARQNDELEQLRLSVVDTMVPAIKLYERMGFEILCPDPKVMKMPDGKYLNELQMICFLTS
ncbi:GNAT family N-acetyltransferase [Kurthia massiliensis]|uniref:GNAT family N-acetyltransferase n=1 Tax=Kurthia massiliensis TaxID=1033739 RepID=UPI000289205A|nr:GNAT family N-acetyltransferase [Kurthia massiliensis]